MFKKISKPKEQGAAFSNTAYIPPKKPYKLRIEKVRKNAKLTQTEAASLLSTSQQQYSRWEKGETNIPLMELCMLSLYFNRSVDFLLGMTDEDTDAFTTAQRAKRIAAMDLSPYFDKMQLWAKLLQELTQAE